MVMIVQGMRKLRYPKSLGIIPNFIPLVASLPLVFIGYCYLISTYSSEKHTTYEAPGTEFNDPKWDKVHSAVS